MDCAIWYRNTNVTWSTEHLITSIVAMIFVSHPPFINSSNISNVGYFKTNWLGVIWMLGDEEKKSTVTWIGIHHYKRGACNGNVWLHGDQKIILHATSKWFTTLIILISEGGLIACVGNWWKWYHIFLCYGNIVTKYLWCIVHSHTNHWKFQQNLSWHYPMTSVCLHLSH